MDKLDVANLQSPAALPKERESHWTTGLERFRHENATAEDLAAPKDVVFHVTSNEVWETAVVRALEEHDAEADGNTFFCIGGLSTFFLFLKTKATHWVNLDPCPAQAKLIKLFCECIIASANVAEFIDIFFEKYPKQVFEDCKRDPELELVRLYLFFLTEYSPFTIPGGFERLKACAKAGNLQSFCVDLNNAVRVQSFKKELCKRGLTARVVYTSNLNSDGWHDVVDPKMLLNSMNSLTNDKHSENVHFLYCAPSRFEKCTCKRKSLIRTTTNLLGGFKGRSCKQNIHHFLVLLKRIQSDLIMAYISRFTPYCKVSMERFLSYYLEYPTKRESFHLFKEKLHELAKTKKEFKEAADTFDLLMEHKLRELEVEGLKEGTFLAGLKWSFPKLADSFKAASPEIQSFMPESVFIIMCAFDIIFDALNKNLDS